MSSTSFASSNSGPQALTIQGSILDASGNPLESSAVTFVVQIRSPDANNCLLYQESILMNMTSSLGVFSFPLGTTLGTRSSGTPAGTNTLAQVFNNSGPTFTGLTCDTGSVYTPQTGDKRKVLLSFDDGSGSGAHTITQSLDVQSVPFALAADTLQGHGANDFVQTNILTAALSQSNLELIFASSSNVSKLINLMSQSTYTGTSAEFTGSVAFDSAPTTSAASSTFTATSLITKSYSDSYIGGKATSGLSSLAAGDSGKILSWNGTQWVAAAAPSTTDSTKLPLAGGTMSGAIDMGAQNITNANSVASTQVITPIVFGSTSAAGTLTLDSTSNATSKGNIILNPGGGAVGIGTTAPYYALDISGSIGNTPFIRLGNSAGGGGNTVGVIFAPWSGRSSPAAEVYGIDDGNGSAHLAVATAATGAVTTATERLRITTEGYVGIGTSTPSQLLAIGTHTESDVPQQGIRIMENGFSLPGADGSTSLGDKLTFWNVSGGKQGFGEEAWGVWTQSSGAPNSHISFYTGPTPGAAPDERMRILSNGNVGIGTSTPGQPLSVAGIIESTSGGIKFPDGSVQTVAAPGTSPLPVEIQYASAMSSGGNSTSMSVSFSTNTTVGNSILFIVAGYGGEGCVDTPPAGAAGISLDQGLTTRYQQLNYYWMPVTTAATTYNFGIINGNGVQNIFAVEVSGVSDVKVSPTMVPFYTSNSAQIPVFVPAHALTYFTLESDSAPNLVSLSSGLTQLAYLNANIGNHAAVFARVPAATRSTIQSITFDGNSVGNVMGFVSLLP